MARELKSIKEFLEHALRKDATEARIKKNGSQTKFKVRCKRHLYTVVVNDQQKATKLTQSLPPGLNVKTVPASN
ncbi:hypothetical protein CANCADRAFT_78652 [Tortispora caseinolytica NRRL Y-17796]|uniref:Large ribosomal subunit protein eL38 n=1 Tax=Tortispora caseinolytica NRRL Y-17796 TaxID=767744 RepID=A0A1E4TJC8_9ASCO|nr:hypothetical protein CANCADRAFT_78652 [Tortispora caseinolytica NRRL Y-17796]